MAIINIQIDIPNADVPDVQEAFRDLMSLAADTRTPKQVLIDEINKLIRQRVKLSRSQKARAVAESSAIEPNITVA